MVRIVPKQEHAGLLTWQDGIETACEALIDQGENPEHNIPRQRVHAENGVRVSVFQAVSPRTGAAGLNTQTEKIRPDDGREIHERSAFGVHVLHDCETGELLAVFLGRFAAQEVPTGFSAFRTACATGVAMDELSKPDDSKIGIFGTGAQAQNTLLAMDAVRNLDTVRVYSPTESHRLIFADEMTEFVDADIVPVESPEAVIAGADIVLALTSSNMPVFDGELLERGQTVCSIVGGTGNYVTAGYGTSRRREIDDTTVERADHLVTHSVEHAREYEQGDLYLPVERGIIDWDDLVPLGDVVAGNHPGREHDDQIVLYKNNTGLGIVDISLAMRFWEEVTEYDLGTEVDVFEPHQRGIDFTTKRRGNVDW